MPGELQIEHRPELEHPVLIAAFRGWNDGAQGASLAGGYLAKIWNAQQFASIDPEDFYDFQATRPMVSLVEGITRRIDWPDNDFYHASPEGLGRDAMLLLGVEPNLRWPMFCEDVINVARQTGCEMVVTLGALLGDVPHTRKIRCTGSATDETLATRLGMQRSRYEGPTGIVGVLHDSARRTGFASASIWVPVPHYVATAPNPKATHALLECLGALLDIGLEMTELEIAASAWERSVDEVVAGDADAQSYVERLEHRYDESIEADDDKDDEDDAEVDEEDWLDEDDLPSGESLAEDFERYLREQGDE
jgi:proteasome assembly chaperone (PAC2) family protein